MNRPYLVSKILLIDGVLLIVIAFVLLFATPLIREWMARDLTPQSLSKISPPVYLNHIAAGILLIPFGVSTLYSAIGVRSGQTFARVIALLNAVMVMILPLIVAVLMGRQYFTEPIFLVATVSICVVGVSMVIPLIWLTKQP